MPRKHGNNANVGVARSERDHGKEAQRRSRGKRTGRKPDEAAGRRPRDLDYGVDDQSASSRLLVASTSSRASGPERAVKASDRSKSSKVLQAVKMQTDRPTSSVEDSGSSTSDSSSSTSDSGSSACYLIPQPPPYDGRPNQRAFDDWVASVENWVSLEKLSRKEVMYFVPLLVTGKARRCLELYVLPTLHSRKWKLKEVFEILQEHCFPFDRKVRLYEQLISAKQGNRKAIWFATEVEFLARHLPHVSGEFLGLVFWKGLNHRTRSKLIMDGIVPGDINLETLVQHASKDEHPRMPGGMSWERCISAKPGRRLL